MVLNNKICGVRDRQWISEWSIVFQMVILHQAIYLTASNAIWRRIKEARHLGTRKQEMLVDETLRTFAQYLTDGRR